MIPVSMPSLGKEERAYLLEAFDSTWISSNGRFLDEFESRFAEYAGVEHALGVSNGTVALHLALVALDVGPGDEVIVPSLTYIATANAVKYCGADPVFADVEARTWGLDAASVRSAVTSRTKAIIAVHLYGHPADMTALREVADAHGLALVEDAAEAPGATWDGRVAGAHGDIGTFSFYGNKVISSGEGGAVTTSSPELAARMRLLRGQGMDPQRRYWFPVTGFNYRMTNLAAAILCGQLERLDTLLELRWAIYRRYDEHFIESGLESIGRQVQSERATMTPWLYCVLFGEGKDGRFRDYVAARLAEQHIDTRPFFIPLHTMPPFQSSRKVPSLECTMKLSHQGLNLPTFPSMTSAQADIVATAVIRAVKEIKGSIRRAVGRSIRAEQFAPLCAGQPIIEG